MLEWLLLHISKLTTNRAIKAGRCARKWTATGRFVRKRLVAEGEAASGADPVALAPARSWSLNCAAGVMLSAVDCGHCSEWHAADIAQYFISQAFDLIRVCNRSGPVSAPARVLRIKCATREVAICQPSELSMIETTRLMPGWSQPIHNR